MGRRRSQRACASAPSMLSSPRGSPELRRRSESNAELSAGAEGATGSEAAPPGDRGGRTRGGGRGSAAAAATTTSTREAEGAERRGDTPARKPDPEAGRMDHHQLGTGRYQVVSARAPGGRGTVASGRLGGPLSASPRPQPPPRRRSPTLPGWLSFPSLFSLTHTREQWCPPAVGCTYLSGRRPDRRPELCEVIKWGAAGLKPV